MMSALEKQLEIARRIDRLLGGLPEVTSVYVIGSVASGQVDERSDVDVVVLSRSETLPLAVRRKLLSSVGSQWRFDTGSQVNPVSEAIDSGKVDGIGVEVHYQSASTISEVLDEVIHKGAITTQKVPFRPYTVAGMLHRAWVLRDKEGVFKAWLAQTKVYPQVLKLNILREFVPLLQEYSEDLESYAARRLEPGLLLFILVRAKDALARTLFALNEVYDPAEKREMAILSSLALLPRNFKTRLDYILQGPFNESGAIERANLFGELANEVLEIVKPHMPVLFSEV